jgi:hypothetical protein
MKNVTVHVPEHINLDQCQKVLATVLGKLGCPGCYSGYNINFQNVVDPARNFSVNKALDVTEVRG